MNIIGGDYAQHRCGFQAVVSGCPRQESNLRFLLRREVSYPLYDEDFLVPSKKPGNPLRYSLARRHRGPGFSGALGRNRTYDLLDRNQTLYPLSYKRKRCTYSPYRESIRKTELNMQQFFENVNHAWVVRFLTQVFA